MLPHCQVAAEPSLNAPHRDVQEMVFPALTRPAYPEIDPAQHQTAHAFAVCRARQLGEQIDA